MPPLGETIGPRRAAVSARLMVDVDRILLTVRPRDLLPAVKLMAAVIVQSQHTGQRTARPRRSSRAPPPSAARKAVAKKVPLPAARHIRTDFRSGTPLPPPYPASPPAREIAGAPPAARTPGRSNACAEMRENWGLHRPGLLPTSRTRRASSERTFRLFPGAWYDRVFSVVARPR